MARLSQYSRVSDMLKILFPVVIGEGFIEAMGSYSGLKSCVNAYRELKKAFQGRKTIDEET